MTIILGMQCNDGGIVVAADGAATFTTATGSPTARQSITKLVLIDDSVIFAHSGMIGVGQRLEAIVRDSWSDKKISKKHDPAGTMQYLRNRFWQEVVKDEVDVVEQAGEHLRELSKQVIMQSFLVAFPPLKGMDRPTLIHFNWQCAPEMLTPNLPCVSLGSGQGIADPFLAFIRRIFWENKAPPNIPDCLLSATWAINHVIQESPGFISPPVQMMTIEKNKDNIWVGQEIQKERLEEHKENIEALEKYISEYRLKLNS
jgi:hypothetical protein